MKLICDVLPPHADVTSMKRLGAIGVVVFELGVICLTFRRVGNQWIVRRLLLIAALVIVTASVINFLFFWLTG